MKVPLSDRLLACAKFVAPGDRVADVGCDHGYLPIYLLTEGIARSAIASDINELPLLSAMCNADKYGVRSKMEFYLSDGVQSIPHNFDVLICAGMGADTMISILEEATWLRSKRYRLILQCQSKTPTLRRFVSETGWRIDEETVVRDGKFLYTVMALAWEPENSRLTVGQWYFPPALMKNPSPELPAYYQRVAKELRIATSHQYDPEKRQALWELNRLLDNPYNSFLMRR